MVIDISNIETSDFLYITLSGREKYTTCTQKNNEDKWETLATDWTRSLMPEVEK